jgi:hypothetical protein
MIGSLAYIQNKLTQLIAGDGSGINSNLKTVTMA